MTFQRFEEIDSWKESRVLAAEIYRVTNEGAFARDYGLKDQIRRASVSVLSNIAEGFEKDSPREFIRYLHIAKGSAGEVRAQLYVALDVGLLPDFEFDPLYQRVCSVSRLLKGLIRYLQSQLTPRE